MSGLIHYTSFELELYHIDGILKIIDWFCVLLCDCVSKLE